MNPHTTHPEVDLQIMEHLEEDSQEDLLTKNPHGNQHVEPLITNTKISLN